MASLLPQLYFDIGNGLNPSDGALLFFNIVGSETDKDTYTTAAATTPHANPVVADSKGVFPAIYITGDYDWVLQDKNLVQINTGSVSELATVINAAFSKNIATLALAVADTGLVDGDAINLAERTTGNDGGGMWDVKLLSTGAANTYNRVAWGGNTGAATDLVLVLRPSDSVDVRQLGALDDGVTNAGTELYYSCLMGLTVVVPEDSGTFVFDLIEAQIDTILDHLKFIRAEQPIILQLPTVDHTRTTTIHPGSPYGKNVTVRGAATSFLAATGVTTDSVAAQNHRVTITGISSTSNFTVGGFAFVKSTAPTTDGNKVLEGVWEVTALTATTAQLKNTAFKSTLPTFTLTGCSIAPALTVLRVHGAVGIDMFSEGHGGLWQSMVLAGNNTGGSEAHAIRNYDSTIELASSTAQPFGCNGFEGHQIYTLAGGVTVAFDSYSSNAGRHGYYELDGSSLVGTRIIGTGNGLAGHACSTNSNAGTSQANCSGNLQRGQTCAGTSIITSASSFMYENGDSGVRCQDNGFFNLTGAVIAGSVSYGLRANGGTIFGSYTTDYGNAALLLIENNGVIDSESKRYYRVGAGSGAAAVSTASGYVTDSDTANGVSILNPEAQYGYLWFGNEADNTEGGIRYRGTSNALDFYTQGALQWSINSGTHLVPSTDDLHDIGSSSLAVRAAYINSFKMRSPDNTLFTVTVSDAGVIVVT